MDIFFFQAEDGIRDGRVTGVQTCALPILAIGAPSPLAITRQLFADLQAARPDVPRLSVATPLPELVEALNAYRPEGLVGYPTVAGELAAEIGRASCRERV